MVGNSKVRVEYRITTRFGSALVTSRSNYMGDITVAIERAGIDPSKVTAIEPIRSLPAGA